MLRTNSKKARENIKAYIMEEFNCFSDFSSAAAFVLKTFIKECYTTENEKKLYKSEFNAFEHWAQGLPYRFTWYYLHTAVNILGDILEESIEERARFTQEQAEQLLTKLIYRELTEGAKNK